ncbi:MAG: hypothetical protein IPM74_12400 [Crocinitomicaceae bacterium]|nr:hypothetical protein [Crocinitomicaceae bacterium]MBK8926676.1 hypothetical protein [Crocinitomicaceae bacterium]
MIECCICCHKNDEQILRLRVPWWSEEKLRKAYNFREELCGGEIDYHLTVTGEELRAIHEANLPPDEPEKSDLSFTPWYRKKDPFIEGQIEAIINSAAAYDKIEIELWYWSSGY